MNDVASLDANIQLPVLEAVADALGLAVIACDRNDVIVFVSRAVQTFYPIPSELLERGSRLRDFLGGVFDLGMRSGTATEKSRRRANREEWIAERVSLHWRERYETVERVGRQRWISLHKRRLPNGLGVVAISDISDQKKREEQVHLDLERIEITENILDSLPNPVFVKDRSLSYIAANKAFCTLHGMNADAILGRSAWDLIEPELAEKFEAADRLVLETGLPSCVPEQIVGADGHDFWSLTHKFRIGDASRAILVTCLTDVTRIVVGIDDKNMPPEVARTFEVRDFSSFQPGPNCYDPFRSIDVQALVEPNQIVGPDAAQVRRGVFVVTSEKAREAPLVRALQAMGHDAGAVGTIRECQDALDAAAAAGLTVDALLFDGPFDDTPIAGPPWLIVQPDWSDDQLQAALSHLLEHGVPDLELPSDGAVDWDILVPSTIRPASEIDVLVAEDNEINQFVFSQILGGLGLSFRIAVNGEEAVSMWQSLNPRLVFMDTAMPVMNGFDAAMAIRALEAAGGLRTPIVAVLTQALDIDRERVVAADMDDHIVKPISPDMIESVYRTFISDTAERMPGR